MPRRALTVATAAWLTLGAAFLVMSASYTLPPLLDTSLPFPWSAPEESTAEPPPPEPASEAVVAIEASAPAPADVAPRALLPEPERGADEERARGGETGREAGAEPASAEDEPAPADEPAAADEEPAPIAVRLPIPDADAPEEEPEEVAQVEARTPVGDVRVELDVPEVPVVGDLFGVLGG